MLVVVVDGDDREVRFLAGDEVGRLAQRDRVCRDRVPELREDRVDLLERLGVLVRGEDSQSRRCRLGSDLWLPRRLRVTPPS
jgi:hypothetical protein